MKKLIVLCALVTGQMASAELLRSDYEARHQAVVEKAVYAACKLEPSSLVRLVQSSSVVTRRPVDQGVVDLSYVTEVIVFIGSEEDDMDAHKAVVKTIRYDHYDHSAQTWGSYNLESVQCN